ncbi:hypothetical protein Fmac_012338 [Flemingia macrophylla]|uniref:Glycosyltransferase n=1 Tax=Flemingia macrophylla TaxID=520843 RepID=A0ABD1MQU4_9FABA
MEQSSAPSHVLVLPFPAEGHIKPMFNLSKLVSHKGHKITFVNTHRTHDRILQFTDTPSFHTQFPDFQLASITDGVPDDHPPNDFAAMITPTSRSKVRKEFRELLSSFEEKEKPSCIIADGMMSTIAMDVARELGVPLITFRTYSATATWVTIHISKIFHRGLLDLHNPKDTDKMLSSIPGLESVFRDRDLQFFIKMKPSFGLDFYIKETLSMTQASGLILNTFDELEAPIITKLTTIFPKVYTIGPVHSLVKTQLHNSPSLHMRKEDRSCITWLDHQTAKSVLYVSFGTVVKLSHEQLLEFWHGLVNSLKPFLWVIRKDLMINKEGNLGNNDVPIELDLGTKERGLLVEWAPQEEVLAHPAVGGFLTHCGWNSTIECIFESVPMLCWPSLTDQTINSRCVSEQWGIGLDMNIGTCDRLIVEKMVNDVMENEIKGIISSTNEIAKKAHESVEVTGSSYHNIENLVKDIRSMRKCYRPLLGDS